jgi:hypothetical protein
MNVCTAARLNVVRIPGKGCNHWQYVLDSCAVIPAAAKARQYNVRDSPGLAKTCERQLYASNASAARMMWCTRSARRSGMQTNDSSRSSDCLIAEHDAVEQ